MTAPLTTADGEIPDKEFRLFRDLVFRQTGIALSPHKRQLVQSRLGKRLRALGLTTFGEYYDVLTQHDADGVEMIRFVNAMTTNKTEFFREAHHFGHLTEVWLPAVRERAERTGERSIRIWSAGCSSGEEPYTIAIVLLEALGPLARCDVRILASDIDTDVLARAEEGTYTVEQASAVPPPLRARYFLRGRGEQAGFVRVRPEVRGTITFRRINLLDARWPIRSPLDVIFCRNVLIYFDRPTQEHLLSRFAGILKPDGLLFLGHSESFPGAPHGLQHHGNTIYRLAPSPADGARPQGLRTTSRCRPADSDRAKGSTL
jgi:chemotaxis protein methyltransferase CheR